MGCCGSLPVDYSSCNMRVPWDCGLHPASFAGSTPTSPGLQTEAATPSPRAESGGLRPSTYPCTPSVCSYRGWGEARRGARKHTSPREQSVPRKPAAAGAHCQGARLAHPTA